MKRRLVCLLLAAMLLLGLACTAVAEAPASDGAQLFHITDAALLLSSEEDMALETYAEELESRYGVGLYIITVDDSSDYYSSIEDASIGFYHDYMLGAGEDRNGAVLVLSMNDRKCAEFFYGPKMEYAFDDYGQRQVEDSYLDNFHDDDWYGGFSDFLSSCDSLLQQAEQGTPVRESPWGMIALFAVISCVIALVVCLILKGKMKSVRKGREANAYAAGELALTASRDQYTHTTETRRKIERESSSSGGGGGSFSGGGGSGRSSSF